VGTVAGFVATSVVGTVVGTVVDAVVDFVVTSVVGTVVETVADTVVIGCAVVAVLPVAKTGTFVVVVGKSDAEAQAAKIRQINTKQIIHFFIFASSFHRAFFYANFIILMHIFIAEFALFLIFCIHLQTK